jgi:hypothetical protein
VIPVNLDLWVGELAENTKLRHSKGDIKLVDNCFPELIFCRACESGVKIFTIPSPKAGART